MVIRNVVGMTSQGYKQAVVCRERKDAALDKLPKLEENLALKNKLKASQVFFKLCQLI